MHESMWGWTLEQWVAHVARVCGVEVSGPDEAVAVAAQWADIGHAGPVELSSAWGQAQARATFGAFRARELVEAGVHIDDVRSVWVDATVVVAPGARLGPGVQLRGQTQIGAGTHVQLGCQLTDTQVADNAVIKPHTVADGAIIGEGSAVGPSAHLRAGAVLGNAVKVGNFVEVKKARLDAGAKASHLSYIGDAHVGEGANIGAGTITCNYDGYGKHHTEIGAGAFVGSNTALVAPVSVGKGAIIGAGSVITQAVPDDCLAVERSAQRNLEGRAARLRAANAKRAGKKP